MYESRHCAPPSRKLFLKRMLRHLLAALALALISLAIGMAGIRITRDSRGAMLS